MCTSYYYVFDLSIINFNGNTIFACSIFVFRTLLHETFSGDLWIRKKIKDYCDCETNKFSVSLLYENLIRVSSEKDIRIDKSRESVVFFSIRQFIYRWHQNKITILDFIGVYDIRIIQNVQIFGFGYYLYGFFQDWLIRGVPRKINQPSYILCYIIYFCTTPDL